MSGDTIMTAAPIYLTEADVGRLVTVKDAIGVLEELFATWGQGATANLPRQRARPSMSLSRCGASSWYSSTACCRRAIRATSRSHGRDTRTTSTCKPFSLLATVPSGTTTSPR